MYTLTIDGNAIIIKGNRRPNLFMIYPKKIFPIKPPIQCAEATNDASSIEIFPLFNGVFSEVNKIIDGLLQPSNAPYATIARFTMKSKNDLDYFNSIYFD